jgi:hypothetical protein
MENIMPTTIATGDVKSDSTIQIIVAITLLFSALNGLVVFIRFLEEREIAREKMRSL